MTRSNRQGPRLQLKADTCPVRALDEEKRRAMHALFAHYYDDAPFERFCADLAAKDRVILVEDGAGGLAGFSTIAVHAMDWKGQPVRIVFSGDTIIDRPHWGSQTFAFAWLRETGRIRAEAPDVPLYWLLISKGYRTYRYLDAFGLAFTPDWRGRACPDLDAIRDMAARRLFGDAYDAGRGVLSYPRSRGRLAPEWAHLSARELARPDVRFFIARNPGYARGDELVCLCALDASNMKPLTQRQFLKGMRPCAAGPS